MILIVLVTGLLIGLVLAVIFFMRLLTHHTFMWLPEWSRPIRTTSHATQGNDRTQPRRTAR